MTFADIFQARPVFNSRIGPAPPTRGILIEASRECGRWERCRALAAKYGGHISDCRNWTYGTAAGEPYWQQWALPYSIAAHHEAIEAFVGAHVITLSGLGPSTTRPDPESVPA